MNTNKILSANMLDLIFEDRNKDYGAYELRKTYPQRITKAVLITATIALTIFAGSVLAKSSKPGKPAFLSKEVTLADIKPDEKKPELPKSEKKPEPVQVRTRIFTQPEIKEDKDVQKPPPSQDDLVNTKIDVVNHDGVDDIGIVDNKGIDDGKDVIEEKKDDGSKEPFEKVEIEAKFSGNWENFLRRNLDPQVPADNGAPAGNHTIIIQFVVDIDGSVSDIRPLTDLGYGMEQEAVRVLKKATKWEPAIQNGHPVKAYRRQPITFQVLDE